MKIPSIQSQPAKPLYTPAEMKITTRNPEMEADWESVWEERGVLRPSTLAREQVAKSQREMLEGIEERARNGRRIRDIHLEKGNIFGKIAFENYMKRGAVHVELVAVPKFGVNIDVRIYPPEIEVKTKEVGQ